jgi:predicted dienelactone hydrolase
MSWSVQEVGDYNVGYREWVHQYEDPVTGAVREINVGAWYPTTDREGEAALYLAGLYRDEEAFLGANVAIAPLAAGFPVHVYSHGDRGWGAASESLMRFFATHGWVSVAPDHTGNTLLQSDDPRPTLHYIHRPLDIQETLNALEDLSTEDALSNVNTDRVLMSGHSFGAYSVWAGSGAKFDEAALEVQCHSLPEGNCSPSELEFFLSGQLADPRIAAGITMAGSLRRGFFGNEGHRSVVEPMLLMSGTEDLEGTADSWPTVQDMDRVAWLELVGGCHQSFAAGICSTLDAELGFSLIDAYAMALGRQAVLADQSDEVESLLSGTLSLSESAIYSVGSSIK